MHLSTYLLGWLATYVPASSNPIAVGQPEHGEHAQRHHFIVAQRGKREMRGGGRREGGGEGE